MDVTDSGKCFEMSKGRRKAKTVRIISCTIGIVFLFRGE